MNSNFSHNLKRHYGYLTQRMQWVIRAGTAVAVLFKIMLAASVGVTFSERSWTTLRAKFITLGGVDSLLSLTHDPTKLFTKELAVKAKLAMLLALTIW